ncbi:hypothetical protein [Coraliomargarita parva]|uniref:hypothetical protein n=1 Tax=Coraliomargarita parva TaxID=3014050 RepID=UPI0022B55404|nr:hypothetical protein [Coraliomargarita parva]
MKRIPLPLFCLGSILLGFAVGYFVAPSNPDGPNSSNTGKLSMLPGSANSAKAGAQSGEAAQSDEALLEVAEGEVLTVANLSHSDIPALSAEQARALLATAFAMPQSDPNRTRLIRDLLEQLARTNPLEAMEMTAQITSLRENQHAKEAILRIWGEVDPVAALNWASTGLANEPASVRNAQMLAIFRGYAQNNPAAAFQAALLLESGSRAEAMLRSRALAEVIETQVRNGDVKAAMLTIETLPADDSSQRENLLRELVNEWASYDPENAAAYVTSLGDEAPASLKIALLSQWAENDPAAAAAWMSSLSIDDPSLGRAASEIIREWARYDLTASAEWLNSLPASSELDRAVASYTFRAAEEDPATAMTWAESITNERMQSRMVERVAASWKETDAEGFQEYLDSSDYTAEEKETLLNARSWGGRGGPGGDGPPPGGGGGRPR